MQPLAMWLDPGREPERPLKGRVHDLYPGVPDNRLFPLETWRRLVSTQLRRSRLDDLTYVGRGHRRLREEVARHLGLARSVACSGEDVIVTVGAQQAIDLVARVLVEPGTVVAVEDPGYSAAHRLFETHRAVVRGVPVDREGLVVDALPDDARVVYVTPSHQFPTGSPCPWRVGPPCCDGRPTTTPRLSRTTTTASSASPTARSSRSRASTARAGSSMSGRSPSR